jgi:hypothetical protein
MTKLGILPLKTVIWRLETFQVSSREELILLSSELCSDDMAAGAPTGLEPCGNLFNRRLG